MEKQFKVFVVMKYLDKDIIKKSGGWYAPEVKSWYFKFDEDDLLSDVLIHTYGYAIKSIEGFIEPAQNMLREKIERGNIEYLKEKRIRFKKLDKLISTKPIIPIYDLYDTEEPLVRISTSDCFDSDDEDKPPVAPTAINIPNRVTYS